VLLTPLIDEDQGKSGATAEDRLGFQRLLEEVSLDHVGLTLGLEMSRLGRSCTRGGRSRPHRLS
jgi:DNA invertase Pin-like site-specific DNA recombinase